MSTEEQDQIFGRLVREERESRRKLAALSAQLTEFGEDLREIGIRFKNDFLAPEGYTKISAALEATQGLPEKAAIVKTLNEIREERTRFDLLTRQLKQFD